MNCTVTECDRQVMALGLCNRHYQQKRKGRLRLTDERNCATCDKSFTPYNGQLYCSKKCRGRAYYLALKSDPSNYREWQSKNQVRRRKPENWEREKARNRKRLKSDVWRDYYNNRNRVLRSKTVHGRVISLNAHVHSRKQSTLYISHRDVEEKFGDIDSWCCSECGVKEDLSFDHIIGFAQGGEHVIENLQILCIPCNTRKGSKDRWHTNFPVA